MNVPRKMMSITAEESEQHFTETWSRVETGFNEFFDVAMGLRPAAVKNSVQFRHDWYTFLFNAVRRDNSVADRLYARLRQWIEEALRARVANATLELAMSGDPPALYRAVTLAYTQFLCVARFACIAFHYLGNAVARRSADNDTIEQLFLKAFHTGVYNDVKSGVMRVILQQVNTLRDSRSEDVDMGLLKTAVTIFNDVGTAHEADDKGKARAYFTDFERHYLDDLRTVYQQRAAGELAVEGGHKTYLEWVDARQDLELGLARALLRADSHDRVRRALDEVVVFPYATDIVRHPESGLAAWIAEWREADLARMYRLLKPVPNDEAVDLMADAVQKHVAAELRAIVDVFSNTVSKASQEDDKRFVNALMELDAKYLELIRSRFQNEPKFHDVCKQAFKKSLASTLKRRHAKRPDATADEFVTKEITFQEVLAAYCDAVMNRDMKDIANPDAEQERLDAVLRLFIYIEDRDVFREAHQSRLAKRLLNTTPNEELELSFLQRLKTAVGTNFTHTLEKMILDREKSVAVMDEFGRSAFGGKVASLGLEFTCLVLTAAHWPSFPAATLAPPPALLQAQDAFTNFYRRKFDTKQLSWHSLSGKATLMITFAKGTKEVTGNVVQAAILIQIHSGGAQTVADLATALKLEKETVEFYVMPMVCHPTQGVLTKVDDTGKPRPPGKAVDQTDVVDLNAAFQFRQRKFRLATSVGGPGGEDPSASAAAAAKRGVQIQACVVRIMKSRRTLPFGELQDEVIAQLSSSFKAQPKQIKKELDGLVEKEYLERDAQDATRFNYKA